MRIVTVPLGCSGQVAVEVDGDGGELDDEDGGGIVVTTVSVTDKVMVAERVLVISEGIFAGGPIVLIPCRPHARHVVVSDSNTNVRCIMSTW